MLTPLFLNSSRYAKTYISTKQTPPTKETRLPQPFRERVKESSCKRSQAIVSLTAIMLPAPHRLRQFRDFQRVYRGAKAVNGPLLRIYCAQNGTNVSRFGIVIPNKLIKKATERNKKKRQIRAAIQGILANIRPGYDVVVSGQAGLVGAEFTEIGAELSGLFKKSNLL